MADNPVFRRTVVMLDDASFVRAILVVPTR